MQKQTQDNITISFKELKKSFSNGKKIIFAATFICFSLATIYALTRPIEYISEGTFRDKAKTNNGFPTFAGLLSGSTTHDNNVIALMNSRTIRERLAKSLNFQADLKNSEDSFLMFKNIWQNIVSETTRYFYPFNLSLQDKSHSINVTNTVFDSEVPYLIKIRFISEDEFEIQDGQHLTLAKLGRTIATKDYTFTLNRLNDQNLTNQTYSLTFLPLSLTAKNISDHLTIEPDRLDKNLLNIKFKNPNRHVAAFSVNSLMDIYKDYLKDEQNQVIYHQIQYLEKRQNEISSKLKTSMENHVLKISDDIKNIGFPNTNLAMEFLTESQNNLQKKLLDIEFELKRLHISKEAGYAYYDTYSLPGDPVIINQMLTEMRNLKQQSDWLNLKLQDSKISDPNALEALLTDQLHNLKTIRDYRDDAKQILLSLDKGQIKENSPLALEDQYLAKIWIAKINDAKKQFGTNSSQVNHCSSQFCTYLKHLIHHFDVYDSSIQERMVHSQLNSEDFAGIDLQTSQSLFISYTNKMNEIESQILQNQFILDEISKADFELSSLSTILNDHISMDMSTKATLLAMNLKDSNNRSLKEQERIKEDLEVQKRFLSTHLKNSNQLLRLNEDLMKYKVKSLQSVTLGLVQQQISLLENNLAEYIQSRISSLKAESEIIEQHKAALMNQMSQLPAKWVSEKLINLQMEMNQKMVEEVSKLVETKNIGSNLEIIQSTVIDPAIAPIHPKPAKILFFAALGSLIGFFLSLSFVIIRDLKNFKVETTIKN